MPSKVSSPVEEARKSGIFGKMRKTRKKKTSGNSIRNLSNELNKSDSQNNTSNTSNTSNTVKRRVIKATPPPTTSSSPTQNENIPPQDSNIAEDDLGHEKNASGNKQPSIQNEALREKTEQWRKERIDAAAALRKENKEKEVMEHRSRSGSTSVEQGEQKEEVDVKTEPIPAILTVAPKFPEHKRKADADEQAGKKSRITEEETEVEAEADGKVETKKEEQRINRIPGLTAVAAVIAVAGIFAARFFRKR